jgi:hypothetical protein
MARAKKQLMLCISSHTHGDGVIQQDTNPLVR